MVASLVKEFVFPVFLLVVSFYLVWFYSKRKGLSLLQVLKPSLLKFLIFFPSYSFFTSVLLLYSILVGMNSGSDLNFWLLVIISYFFACVVSFPFSEAFSSLSVVRQRFNVKPLKSWLRVLLVLAFFISNFLLSFSLLIAQAYSFASAQSSSSEYSSYASISLLDILFSILLALVTFAYSVIVTVFFYKLALKTGFLNSKNFHDLFSKSLKNFVLLIVVLFFVTNFFYFKFPYFSRLYKYSIMLPPLPFSTAYYLYLSPLAPLADSYISSLYFDTTSSLYLLFQSIISLSFLTTFFVLTWFFTLTREVKIFKLQSVILLLFMCITYVAGSTWLNRFFEAFSQIQ